MEAGTGNEESSHAQTASTEQREPTGNGMSFYTLKACQDYLSGRTEIELIGSIWRLEVSSPIVVEKSFKFLLLLYRMHTVQMLWTEFWQRMRRGTHSHLYISEAHLSE